MSGETRTCAGRVPDTRSSNHPSRRAPVPSSTKRTSRALQRKVRTDFCAHTSRAHPLFCATLAVFGNRSAPVGAEHWSGLHSRARPLMLRRVEHELANALATCHIRGHRRASRSSINEQMKMRSAPRSKGSRTSSDRLRAPTGCIPGRSPNSRNCLTGPRVTLRSTTNRDPAWPK